MTSTTGTSMALGVLSIVAAVLSPVVLIVGGIGTLGLLLSALIGLWYAFFFGDTFASAMFWSS